MKIYYMFKRINSSTVNNLSYKVFCIPLNKAVTHNPRVTRQPSGQRAGLVITRSWVRASLAPGCRVATMGQLLFAPWAWAYSILHP